ncbi:helix-turn-helix domain-containing protein [Mycobacteroides abscessus]|uniref:helix-turn-helix domain-containing protein n=1 Tax=Mycobacteroides abscessus TaxID=36809 RepID=UPI0012AC4F21|nr:helix-turn-helix transcriptional regulator [Mycobacteroides abscessus]
MPVTTVEINGFATRVIRELKGRGMSELAEKLAVDRSYINKIELGHSTRVSTVFYARLIAELAIADHRVLLANPHGTTVAA